MPEQEDISIDASVCRQKGLELKNSEPLLKFPLKF